MAARDILNLESDSDENYDDTLNTDELLARELLRTPENSNNVFRL